MSSFCSLLLYISCNDHRPFSCLLALAITLLLSHIHKNQILVLFVLYDHRPQPCIVAVIVWYRHLFSIVIHCALPSIIASRSCNCVNITAIAQSHRVHHPSLCPSIGPITPSTALPSSTRHHSVIHRIAISSRHPCH